MKLFTPKINNMLQSLETPTISAVVREIDKAIRWTENLNGYMLLRVDILSVNDISVCLFVCERTPAINYIQDEVV